MTNISASDIEHLAVLSGLSLTENEEQLLSQDIRKIISYVDKLDELNVEGVEPTYQVTDLINVSREDNIAPGGVQRGELLALAPEVADNQVKVPKVL